MANEHLVEILDRAKVVSELGLAHAHDERRRDERLVAKRLEGRDPWRRLEQPRFLTGAAGSHFGRRGLLHGSADGNRLVTEIKLPLRWRARGPRAPRPRTDRTEPPAGSTDRRSPGSAHGRRSPASHLPRLQT